MQKIRLFLYVAVCLMLTALVPLTANASHSWGKNHWDLSTADTEAEPLKLGDNLTTLPWTDSLNAASDDWNDSVLKTEVTAGMNSDPMNCEPTLDRVEACNAEYGDNGWLGIAQIWVYRGRSSHIAQGVVMFNDTYFNFSPYNSQPWRDFVMCQEVGHTLGLDHQDENFSNPNLGTCMDYTSDPDGTISDPDQLDNRYPNQHDYDEMMAIYAHLNETDSGGGPGKGGGNGKGKPSGVGANIDLKNPSAWGQAIKQDARGYNSVFERDLGNGQVLITYVIWVQ